MLLVRIMIVLFLKLQKLEMQPTVILIKFKTIAFVYLLIERKWDHVSQRMALLIRVLGLAISNKDKSRKQVSRKRKKYLGMIRRKDIIHKVKWKHHRYPIVRDKKWSKE